MLYPDLLNTNLVLSVYTVDEKKNLFSPSTYIEKILCATRDFSSSNFFSYPFNSPKKSPWIIQTSIFQANFSLRLV